MGPRSTAPFVDLVVTECQRQYGARYDDEFPPMMIYSLPTPFYLDRPIDHAAMQTAIIAGLRKLEQTGVQFIAMLCNSAHIYYEALAASIHVPLLNMITETLCAIPPGAEKVALLATRPTAESGLYQGELCRTGLELVERDDWQAQVDQLLLAIKAGDQPASRTRWANLLDDITTVGVDTLLIACTDLNAVSRTVETPLAILDATACLARATVRRWRETSPR